ncbi:MULTISPECIES: hypothetical protein [Enterococcus]|uniref:hypothetical protein n=1 Tax=Enterococcus TaxID=1350 RepID=UPI00112A5498|nr:MULTISPECIES: hypothetical protein [unclassified Enterococcus]MBK0038786.1 hypothetical protein [Enterococcus sp. S52]MBK0071813.1 hypothetical protein [Enterococcus sp. S53]MBK0142064.1 hypothetical protein [Enterococcus sp. S76]MBK0145793.1 hypothetical protein [Enterococcus sp. S77]TPR57396.1 hypothetical protein FJU10_09395 [Enterococcus sp. OL5]
MNIIYPPLVEQCYEKFFKNDDKVSKAEVYQFLIYNQFINNNGSATKIAIDNQWIQEYVEEPNISFEEFLVIYPVFKKFDQSLFQMINGFWEISSTQKNVLNKMIDSDWFSYEEKLQIQAFLNTQMEEEE